jgi:lysophospholipase L1-like esterase
VIRSLITTLVATLAVAATAQQTIPDPASLEAMGRWERHWWERVIEFQEENASLAASPESRNIVLLGSSSMMHWREGDRAERLLPEGPFLNRGIGADGIGRGERGILHRLESSVFDCNPSHVFLLNGRNDLGSTMRTGEPPVEEVAAVYREVIETIQETLPDVTVCVVTCAPVNFRYEAMAPLVVEFNAMITQIAAELGCPVIDLHARLVGEDGLLPPELTHDGLHFNNGGFEILGEEIGRVLQSGGTVPALLEVPEERSVLLMGDFLMSDWWEGDRMDRYLPDVPATFHPLHGLYGGRMLERAVRDGIFDQSPTDVFLATGLNDLGDLMRRGSPPLEETIASHREIVDAIQSHWPEANLCLVVPSPLRERYAPITPHLRGYREAILALAEERGLAVIDLFDLMADEEGLIPEALSPAGCHLGDEGYRIFGEAITQHLEEMN